MNLVSDHIYILTKLNELAEQFQLHPSNLMAVITSDNKLKFPDHPGDSGQYAKREALLEAIGCASRTIDIDDGRVIMDRIDAALNRTRFKGAPDGSRSHSRR